MAIQNIMDTKIPQNFSTALYNEAEWDMAPEHTDKCLYVLVNAVSQCLGAIKSTKNPVAVVFEENNLDFICGAVVEYHENEDDSNNPGNWSYVWTFYKDDIPENARKVTISEQGMSSYFRGTASQKYGMGFESQESLLDIMRFLLRTISQWLDDNAKEGEEIGVDLDGVVIFKATVENGEIVKAVEPIGEVKVLIKGDAEIEV